MSGNKLEEQGHALLFSIRRSVRYHYRRVRFFDNIHRIATFSAAFSGTATVASVLATREDATLTLCFAITVALFSVADLILIPSQRARAHNDFAKRYFDLEKQIISEKNLTPEKLTELTVTRLDIEADEPPPHHILNAICHNELIRAGGYSESQYATIKWYQRWFAQILDIDEQSIKKPASS